MHRLISEVLRCLMIAAFLPAAAGAETIAVLADRIIVGDSDTAISNGAILVEGNTISSVGSRR